MARIRAIVVVVAVGMSFASGLPAIPAGGSQEATAKSGPLKVTIQYTGAGTVDKEHRLWIWVFDTPTIDSSSIPIAASSVSENEGTVAFESLPETVYIAAAFDEKGGYDGASGPPPSGTPIAVHGDQGSPEAVRTGENATVRVTFDDTVRMP